MASLKQHETRDPKEPNMGTPSPPPMMKTVLFCGRSAVLACDGRCDKAWGINKRPQLYFQESLVVPRALAPGERARDSDDTVYLGDAELGTAPEDPGTYEGGHGKPSAVPLTDPSRMNKWCARECERSAILEPGEALVSPDLARPRPNIPGRPYPTDQGGAEPGSDTVQP